MASHRNKTSRKNCSRWLGRTALLCSRRDSVTMNKELKNSSVAEATETLVLNESVSLHIARRTIAETT